jgi:hypothetical protein
MAAGASNLKVYEFEKNRALVSNQTAHEADPQTFASYLDVINDVAGRRKKRQGTGAPKGGNAGAEITALHEFLRTDPTTGVETYYIFRTFDVKIQKWTGAAWADCVLPFAPASAAWVFKNFNNRCFATNGKDHFVYFDGSTGPVDGREWFYVGIDAPAVAPGYAALTGTDYIAGTLAATNASNLVTGTGTVWVIGGSWSNRWIDISGVRYQISVVNSTTQITLTAPYKGVTGAALGYSIYSGLMDWSEPPFYAIAYKNAGGHYSNISPKLHITEKDQVGRTVTLLGIPYSAAAYQNGYTQIQVFRSAKDGITLVAIGGANGVLPNANSGATTSWSENAGPPSTYRDVDLTTLEAPLTLNARPVDATGNPLAFTSIAEWAGRLVAICPRKASIYISGAPDDIRLGLPEECWPAEYALRVNGPRGMVELGTGSDNDQLVVHTSSGDRVVVGWEPTQFRLRRIETRHTEGFQGGSVEVGGSLVELHRDKRLMDYGDRRQLQVGNLSGSGNDLSLAIQDKLDACNAATFTKARITWFAYKSKSYLFVSVPKTGASASNDGTLVYDYDLENFYEWSLGFSAFATIHNTATGELELWAGTPAGDVFQLLADVWTDGAGLANIVPSIKTAWCRPFGENGRGQVQWIEIYTPEPTAFSGKLYLDEEPNLTDPGVKGTAFTFDLPQTQYQSAKARKWRWKPSRPFIFNSMQIELVFPDTDTEIRIEKIVVAVRQLNEPEGVV